MKDPLIYRALTTDAGLRLDACLRARLSGYSRAQIGKFIKEGAIRVNEQLSKPSMMLRGQETISFIVPDRTECFMAAEDLALDIIYSDEAIAVINKAAGMVVHPGAGVRNNTLCNALLHHFPGMAVGNVDRPGIVHRLDKDTSGLMVIAKTHAAHQFLSAEFKAHRVTKIYQAWCWGQIDRPKIELRTGHIRHPYNPLRFFTGIKAPSAAQSGVRIAHTSIELIEAKLGISLVLATLHTGRTHQIRAHMADYGYPLLGDRLYGGARALSHSVNEKLASAIANLKGQALHAFKLSFVHPLSKELVSFTAPLPAHLAELETIFHSL